MPTLDDLADAAMMVKPLPPNTPLFVLVLPQSMPAVTLTAHSKSVLQSLKNAELDDVFQMLCTMKTRDMDVVCTCLSRNRTTPESCIVASKIMRALQLHQHAFPKDGNMRSMAINYRLNRFLCCARVCLLYSKT